MTDTAALPVAALHALGEPNRLAIVQLLRGGPMTVGDIATRLGLRQPQASKHLKVLRQDGLLNVRADANRRYYALRPEPFHDLDHWISSFRQVMGERYDKLDDYLQKVQARQNPMDRP